MRLQKPKTARMDMFETTYVRAQQNLALFVFSFERSVSRLTRDQVEVGAFVSIRSIVDGILSHNSLLEGAKNWIITANGQESIDC